VTTLSATISIEPVRQPEVIGLLQQSDDFALSLYPPEGAFLLNVDELEEPGVTLFVARVDGEAVGIAALVRHGDGPAELKRMFVSPSARGLGIAGSLLRALETEAISTGVRTLQLETGPLSHSAIALYEKSGYTLIPNFGQYLNEEHSVCYEKVLA
jgi:putative acetyltransferase